MSHATLRFKTIKSGAPRREPCTDYEMECKSRAVAGREALDFSEQLRDATVIDLDAPAEIPQPRDEEDLPTSWNDDTDLFPEAAEEDEIDPEVIEAYDSSCELASTRALLGLPELCHRGRHTRPLDFDDFEDGRDEDYLAANGMHIVTLR